VSHSRHWRKSDFLTFATVRGQLPPSGRFVTLMQVLYPHMKIKDIIFCPSDPTDQKNPKSTASYWWKVAIDKAWYGVDCPKECRKESDFGYNADQIAFYERNGWHVDQASGLRNGTRINVAYLDTHVRMVILRNATSGDPINCAANTNGEPMYFNFDNDQPKQTDANPPRTGNATRYVDPGRYSDVLDY
jgi:prepilin-type processing-associated H-X9-DG protein